MKPNPHDPSAGDLVTVDPALGADGWLPMFSTWGRRAGDAACGKFPVGSVAVVLEDLHERRGNGVRILTDSGTVGWVNVHTISAVR